MAVEILILMSEDKQILVDQAKLVTDELIRCAILWHEQWHEALDEASKLYFQVVFEIFIFHVVHYNRFKSFQENNPEAMIELLQPLHALLEKGAETSKEQSFKQVSINLM